MQTGVPHDSLIFAAAGAVALVLLLAWVIALQRRTRRLENRFDEIFAEASGENMGRLLADYLTTVRSTATIVNRMKAEHEKVEAILPTVIRHVGLVRFSPFHDTGGDQSFALALLDGQGDGVIVTALHSRTDSRLYAKPVERGASPYSLSPEERDAMDRAFHRPSLHASAG
ncbi:MAG: DUF4446 family protein [Chloroflexota bacterium]